MVYIARTAAQGFIVDSGRDATHSQRAVTAWRAAMGNVAAPAFVFLTHAHPDHIGGVYVYAATWPGVAIHVASAGVMRECLAWQAQMCNVFKGWSAQQCTFNLTMSLTVATATQLQALRGDEGGSMRIVASSGTTETVSRTCERALMSARVPVYCKCQ
jgi:beta-lactamase superfamily II metal-dependent hydrolase